MRQDNGENRPKRRRRRLLGYGIFFNCFTLFTYFLLATNVDYYVNMPPRTHLTWQHHERCRVTTMMGGQQGEQPKRCRRCLLGYSMFFFIVPFLVAYLFSSYWLILLCQHVTEDTSNTTAPWETHDDNAMGGWWGEWPRKRCRRLLRYSMFFLFISFLFIYCFILIFSYQLWQHATQHDDTTRDAGWWWQCGMFSLFDFLITNFFRYYDNALRPPPPTVWRGWGRNNGVSRCICISSPQVFFFVFSSRLCYVYGMGNRDDTRGSMKETSRGALASFVCCKVS